jgi:hypothetical protein
VIRSRIPRSVVAATAAVALIIGLMAGTTSAMPLDGSTLAAGAAAKPKPTPTPTATPTPTTEPTPTPVPPPSDSRRAYFGDSSGAGNGLLDPTAVTAGGVFAFEVLARNTGSQTLTHAVLRFGATAIDRTAADYASSAAGPIPDQTPSLPSGATILSATATGTKACPPASGGTAFTCDLGNFTPADWVQVRFIVQAPAAAVDTWIWASFKVAENVNDQGANRNTFYADAALPIAATNSNGNSTLLTGNQPLRLSTAGLPMVSGDPQITTVEVPGALGGLISIFETDDPTGCTPKCIGQTARVNVRDGELLSPYLLWTLVIFQTDVVAGKGGVIHTLDNGDEITIANVKTNACSPLKETNCIESFEIDKRAGTTTIVFRTPTNGAVRGYG